MANIEGLLSSRRRYKLKMLRERMETLNTIMLALTETHLNPAILDAEVHMEGFQIYRADRSYNRKKGGAAIYLRNDFAVDTEVVSSGSNGIVEYLMLHLKSRNIVVMNVYRPPTAQANDFIPVINKLKEDFYSLGDPTPTLVLCGDFNMPRTNWVKGHTAGGSDDERRQASHMMEFRDELFLSQKTKLATRHENILDLVFVNNEDLIIKITPEDTIMSDHRLLVVDTVLGFPKSHREARKIEKGFLSLSFFHKNTKWKEIEKDLREIEWIEELRNKDVEEILTFFREKLLAVCTKHTQKKRKNKHRKLIIPRDRKVLIIKKSKLIKKMHATGNFSADMRTKIEQFEKQISRSHLDEMHREEEKAIGAIKENNKYFFKYANDRSTIRTDIGPLKRGDDLVSDPLVMTEILREQYESVFSVPLPVAELDPEIDENRNGDQPELRDITLTPMDFIEAAKGLRMNSAPGQDGIPAILIKKTIHVIAEPLAVLWNESLASGVVPESLKIGKITPIYKGGDRTLAVNYRPIALTSHIIKLVEKILVKSINEFLDENDLHNAGQHGFRSKRSCLSQLLEHQLDILEALGDGLDVDVIYLDFAKAFDKVDHGILLHKLKSRGIKGILLRWIEAFLTGRKQCVAVDGAVSSESAVISGVPQGSVLGPLLFLIHISDINDSLLHSTATSFADDTRIRKSIKSIEDCYALQTDLSLIYQWADANNMLFNGKKFELMRYSASGGTIDFQYRTSLDEVIVQKPRTCDLGVVVSDSANFDDQVNNLATKGRQRIGWILRVFKTRERTPMLVLYRSLVLPILEYCCQLWSPTKIGMIRQLEAVQRTFTSRIEGLSGLDYWERLKQLKLYSLERRRERYFIIYTWKIINGLAPNIRGRDSITTYSSERRGVLCRVPQVNRGALQRHQTLRESSLVVLGPRLFNVLPREIRACNANLITFKSQVDAFLATVPDRPCLAHYSQSATDNSIIQQLAQLRAEQA